MSEKKTGPLMPTRRRRRFFLLLAPSPSSYVREGTVGRPARGPLHRAIAHGEPGRLREREEDDLMSR
ncbi:hypothetical protein V5799_016859 [Amblyomma americanum]|uniref:Uncharacterized protein n=1 Tax=Amblyomma americanum TaxID=6943 RepID=A0AAQ4F536_AMBAM